MFSSLGISRSQCASPSSADVHSSLIILSPRANPDLYPRLPAAPGPHRRPGDPILVNYSISTVQNRLTILYLLGPDRAHIQGLHSYVLSSSKIAAKHTIFTFRQSVISSANRG